MRIGKGNEMQPTKLGRPPKYPLEGGSQKGYMVKLTPLQAKRALQYGPSVSAGVNAILREFVRDVKNESERE